jgi:RNA polymerase sigma-70 factor (ECF subfamily)
MVRRVDEWTTNSPALADLLARVALADRAAFAALYRQTSAHLLGVILRINTNRAQAEGVLQDVYVNVWRSARSFDDLRSQPLTWLTSVARNRAIDSLRRQQAQARPAAGTVADRLPGGDSSGALQHLHQAAQAHALHECMAQLSHDQQHCLALAYYQGLSHREVADQLAQPLHTVKRRVRHTLLHLKSGLSNACGLSDTRAAAASAAAVTLD